MEAFLDALKYEQTCEAFGDEDPIDFMCDDSTEEEDEEEDEQDEDTKSHMNEEGLPENNLVKCVGVDKEGRGLYVFK